MKKKLGSLILAIFLISSYLFSTYSHAQEVQLNIPEPPVKFACKSSLLMDLKSGRIIYGQNIDKKVYPASTTKLMTAIVSTEKAPLTQMMSASKFAISTIGVGAMHIGIQEGEIIQFGDLLKAMLLTSANDSCNIVAENTYGTIPNFVAEMNKKAKKIGALNTHFVNTHGMFDKDHYTTARDLATIARYAYLFSKNAPAIRAVTQMSSYTMNPTNKHSEWYGLTVTNKLRSYKSKYWTKVLGLKTGFTSQSGHNFIGIVEDKNGTKLLSVMTGVQTYTAVDNVFAYSNRLLNFGYEYNKLKTVLPAGTTIKNIPVKNSFGGKNNLNLVSNIDVKTFVEKDINVNELSPVITLNTPNNKIKAPISKGQVIGKITYTDNGVVVAQEKLVAGEDVPVSFAFAKTIVLVLYLSFLGLFIAFAIYLKSLSSSQVKVRNRRPKYAN